MTFKIVCSDCKAHLYSGFDLKSSRDILKSTGGICKSCGTNLSPYDFTIDVNGNVT
jgi:hypothetical protein